MLKKYRRRFVIIIMAFTATVLLAALTVLGAFIYRSDKAELEDTMRMIIAPWDDPGDRFRTVGGTERPDAELPGPSADGGSGEPPALPDGETPPERADGGRPHRDGVRRDISGSSGILAVFYKTDSDSISVLSDENYDADGLYGAVSEAISSEKNFGRLKSRGLIYYKESVGEDYKIAFADSSYLDGRLIRSCLIMGLIYLASLLLFFFVSLWLSKLAAKPMEDAISMERRFVADISHDLKTPITVILANNSIIRSDPDARVSEQRQWIDSTDEAAKNMMSMVSEMLTLSSLESADANIELSPLSLSAAAEKCVLQMESVAYERGVELRQQIEPDITVKAAPEYIDRILSGLIDNALKYEPAGGAVEIALTSAKKKACFSVKNLGSVIPEDEIPHIFERFWRGDKARGMSAGHGLGLPIIKQMTELLKGTVCAESGAENGTVFKLFFDLCE